MEQKYLDYALNALEQIVNIPSPSGFADEVSAFLMKELEGMGYHPRKTNKGGVTVDLGGAEGNALLLCCHVDTLGGMVAQVKEDGRLKLTPVGGLSPNNAEAENVKIHTRSGKVYDGTFQLVDASWHVNPNYESTARTFDVMEVVVDERTASAEQTRALGIEVGVEEFLVDLNDDLEPPMSEIAEIEEEELVDPNTLVDSFNIDDPVRMYLKGSARCPC
jgi:putative aminopeptidase FrvX